MLARNRTMKMQMPSDEQRLAVESFRTFLVSEVAPIVRVFRDRPIPKETLREITQGIAEFGLPGASLAREHGGMGLSVVTEAMLFEELCAVSVEVAFCVMVNLSVVAALAELPETRASLRERYLPGLLAGRSFGGFCVDAGDADSTVERGVLARWDLDGFVVRGELGRVPNGHYSDFLVTGVRLDSGACCHLLIDREEHGYQSRMVERPALGGPSSSLVSFNEVRLPAGQLVWEEGDGAGHGARLLERFHAGAGMLAVGLMRAALEASIVVVQDPACFDRPAANYPLVAVRIAEMVTRLDAARLMCFRAYSMMDVGVRCQMQAAMARWYVTEMVLEACREALQLAGGRAADVERLVREAMLLPIPDAATDLHKLMIARELTGLDDFGGCPLPGN
ncbi:Acyl-CoA dehydrogenase [compost metagenome]